ncbi:MAG: NADH-quinone oxidoreductase subunit C [Holosporales bacterium]|jgi:NADH:ubiquinone oxidoreductase subunit C|nr:NADH-quinone oxidoreductase subunit C [Holosporales bacterium]
MPYRTQSAIAIYAKIQQVTGFEFDEIDETLATLYVPSHQLIRVLTILFHNVELSYRRLVDIVVVDLLCGEKQLEINYIIMSGNYDLRLNVCIKVNEGAFVNSVESLYAGAHYRECKIANDFELSFNNGSGLRNIWETL